MQPFGSAQKCAAKTIAAMVTAVQTAQRIPQETVAGRAGGAEAGRRQIRRLRVSASIHREP